MSATHVEIRKGLAAAVTAQQGGVGYVLPFILEETYFPSEDLENLQTNIYVKLVTSGFASDRQLRSINPLNSVPVQIAIQKKVVNKNDTAELDDLMELLDQLMATAMDDELGTTRRYTWQRNEPLQDENGLPFAYEQLTTKGVFQAIFIAMYQQIKQ